MVINFFISDNYFYFFATDIFTTVELYNFNIQQFDKNNYKRTLRIIPVKNNNPKSIESLESYSIKNSTPIANEYFYGHIYLDDEWYNKCYSLTAFNVIVDYILKSTLHITNYRNVYDDINIPLNTTIECTNFDYTSYKRETIIMDILK